MTSRAGPRSAADATRFTSTTPQPTSKSSAAKSGPVGETIEQRMQRLRAAHLAARNAPLSTSDRIMMGGRKVFDAAHRITLTGLFLCTVLAGVFSVYTVTDMLNFNKVRREDFLEAKRRIEADELASARLAFLNGTASEEQIRLVEDTLRQAEMKGAKLPPLLSAPSKAVPKEPSLFQQVDARVRDEAGGASQRSHEKMEEMKRKVREAFDKEREKEDQQNRAVLDRMDLEPTKTATEAPAPAKKSGWRFW